MNTIKNNNRLFLLDNIRGIAFIFMIIHHIFYFYDVSRNYNTSYANNKFVSISGKIARTIFILLAGYATYSAYQKYSKENKSHIKQRFFKSFEILVHAGFISGLTYILYPEYFIRFGILHFLAVGTLIAAPLSPYPILTILVFLASIYIKYPRVNNFIDTITGSNVQYSMMDYFSLKKALPILLFGLIIGQHFDINKLNIPFLKNNLPILTYLGKNSLNIYTLHLTILIIFYTYFLK